MVGYDSTKAVTLLFEQPLGNIKSGRHEAYFQLLRNKVEKKTLCKSRLAVLLKTEEAAAVAPMIRRLLKTQKIKK